MLIRYLTATLLIVLCTHSCSRPAVFGEDINDATQSVSVSEARQLRNRGRTVIVRGTLANVCQEEGCNFALVDDSSEIITRFIEEGVGIPITSTGTVLVKGTVVDTVISNTHVPAIQARGVKFVDLHP